MYTKTDHVYNSGDIPPYISHHPQEGCYFVSSLPQSLNHGAFSSDQAQPLAFCSLPPRPQVLIVTNSKRSKQTVYFVHIVYVVDHIFLFAFTLFVPAVKDKGLSLIMEYLAIPMTKQLNDLTTCSLTR